MTSTARGYSCTGATCVYLPVAHVVAVMENAPHLHYQETPDCRLCGGKGCGLFDRLPIICNYLPWRVTVLQQQERIQKNIDRAKRPKRPWWERRRNLAIIQANPTLPPAQAVRIAQQTLTSDQCYCLNPPYFFYPPKFSWCERLSGPRPDFFGIDPWVPTDDPGSCANRYRALKQ